MIAHVSASHGDESFETKAYRMDSIAERKGPSRWTFRLLSTPAFPFLSWRITREIFMSLRIRSKGLRKLLYCVLENGVRHYST